MVRDGHPRRGLVGHLGQVGALNPGLGVLQGVQVAGRQRRDGLGADHHARILDHLEHLRDAVVHVTDQPALGRHVVLTEGQLTGRRDLQAHLVLDVGDEHAVTLAQLAGLRVEQELGHEEQRQTLGARAGALGAGQHQVEDVLEQVVRVGGGDEPLHAVDVPGAVLLLDGLGPAGADVRAGVRLGEHHGRAPAALGGQHRPLLLLLGGEVVEDLANPAPPAYIHTAGLAPSRCSCSAHSSALGIGMPPSASSRPTLSQPASMTARTDFLKDSGSVTECVSGSKTGGLRSPSTNESATGPSASRLISSAFPGRCRRPDRCIRLGPAPCRRPVPRTG